MSSHEESTIRISKAKLQELIIVVKEARKSLRCDSE